MRDEQRLLLAFGLTMALLVGYQMLFPPPPPPAEQAAPVTETTPAQEQEAAAPEPPPVEKPETAQQAKKPESAPTPAATVTLVTDEVFATVAATQVVTWKLPKYRAAVMAGSEAIDLCARHPQPCFAWGYDGLGHPDEVAVIGTPPEAVRTTWRYDGGKLMANLRLLPRYRAVIEFSNSGDGAPPVGARPFVEMHAHLKAPDMYVFSGLRLRRAGEMEEIEPDDLEPTHRWEGRFDWVMWDQKYFGRALMPPEKEVNIFVRTKRENEDDVGTSSLRMELQPLNQNNSSAELNLFSGPKEMQILQRTGYGLQESIDFGWTGFLGRPLVTLMHLFQGWLGNYGWAIVLLTILIKVAVYPLTRKSYRSMQQMSKLRPKMQELQKKFKDDRQRLNQEMMNLYKTEKVNPFGGCLPIFIQIPVFFALYNVLLVSIELRHADFLWVQDLSSPDTIAAFAFAGMDLPIRILPLIMGVTMFAQQKMTPTTVDPAQQKIFAIMPIMFTFLFYGFPSGLVLYWLTNNVVTIGQQWWIQRQMKAEEA